MKIQNFKIDQYCKNLSPIAPAVLLYGQDYGLISERSSLIINSFLYNIENKDINYTDTVTSKGAYNILEDEVISTLASNVAIESQIAIIAAKLTLDKIHLFMLKNENSKF